jgi:RNA polymerase sigma-70 factor (ECF subfamily)
VRKRLASGSAPGRYQLLAAINAVHTDGDSPDWTQIVALYDQLLHLDDSPLVRLSRAIAVGESDGAATGLALLEPLEAELSGYHAFHAARADALRRLGRAEASRAAYDAAIALADNAAEIAFLTRRRDATG